MRSRFESLKKKAVSMRRHGAALRDVEKRLGIPRSTLSYWFHDVQLSDHHKQRLQARHEKALITARKEAVKWHNAQKKARMKFASDEAKMTLDQINTDDNAIIELSLALLYLGEGAKKTNATSMGNSDPLILRFFVKMLQRLYNVPVGDMKCELHLRADQDANQLTRYWSRALGIPKSNFNRPSFDKRTKGRPTYLHYKGVCIVRCSRVAIQRRLVYIATMFCNRIAEPKRG